MRVHDMQPWIDAGVLVPSGRFEWVPGAWVEDALCAQVDPELFHLKDGQDGRAAKKVCGRCQFDVKERCLAYAVLVDDRNAVYGGMTPKQRDALAVLAVPGTGSLVKLSTRKGARQDSVDRRDAAVEQLTAVGASAAEIKSQTGVSVRNVRESRRRLREQASGASVGQGGQAA
ncbi:WhiB family transcriptional regulator [Micromonospora arborensis]|uniref:WhiB family transcriptional regulator n=1 Tax=Micromonospora arborensis TaxID=2116518 RepID=UPI003410FCBE